MMRRPRRMGRRRVSSMVPFGKGAPMNRLFWPTLAVAASLAVADGAAAQIKLGVAGPITGGSAAFGAQLKNGVEQAVEDINADGGILGLQVTISDGDDCAIT